MKTLIIVSERTKLLSLRQRLKAYYGRPSYILAWNPDGIAQHLADLLITKIETITLPEHVERSDLQELYARILEHNGVVIVTLPSSIAKRFAIVCCNRILDEFAEIPDNSIIAIDAEKLTMTIV